MEEAIAVGAGVMGRATVNRQCSVEIVNACKTYSLKNPRMYVHSGHCAKPPSPVIEPSRLDVSTYCKVAYGVCGAVAVLTYDLHENGTKQFSEKLAVMFSVPFDFNLFDRLYSVGVFDKTKECDKKLYEQMYYKGDPAFSRGKASQQCLTFKGDHFTVMATMSDCHQAYLKVRITENAVSD